MQHFTKLQVYIVLKVPVSQLLVTCTIHGCMHCLPGWLSTIGTTQTFTFHNSLFRLSVEEEIESREGGITEQSGPPAQEQAYRNKGITPSQTLKH